VEALPDDTVIDGEIVAYGEDGRAVIQRLAEPSRRRARSPPLRFDLLTLRGRDLTRETLERRRELLRAEGDAADAGSIRYSAFVIDPDGHRIEGVCHAPMAPDVDSALCPTLAAGR
jgi:ATP-dependent DNA ligase